MDCLVCSRFRKEHVCFDGISSVQTTNQRLAQLHESWDRAVPIGSCSEDVVTQVQENLDIHV